MEDSRESLLKHGREMRLVLPEHFKKLLPKTTIAPKTPYVNILRRRLQNNDEVLLNIGKSNIRSTRDHVVKHLKTGSVSFIADVVYSKPTKGTSIDKWDLIIDHGSGSRKRDYAYPTRTIVMNNWIQNGRKIVDDDIQSLRKNITSLATHPQIFKRGFYLESARKKGIPIINYEKDLLEDFLSMNDLSMTHILGVRNNLQEFDIKVAKKLMKFEKKLLYIREMKKLHEKSYTFPNSPFDNWVKEIVVRRKEIKDKGKTNLKKIETIMLDFMRKKDIFTLQKHPNYNKNWGNDKFDYKPSFDVFLDSLIPKVMSTALYSKLNRLTSYIINSPESMDEFVNETHGIVRKSLKKDDFVSFYKNSDHYGYLDYEMKDGKPEIVSNKSQKKEITLKKLLSEIFSNFHKNLRQFVKNQGFVDLK